jgi:hypothetical protein
LASNLSILCATPKPPLFTNWATLGKGSRE